ncbi:MAG TPA: Hsp20/alpha crystallin family protein [Chthoniobacterales bacterium]|jgi:HSP20 family protein|nr:Hsp20/alpha crystallin family protein [Chthoniobacterales bacterium]
MNRIRGIKLRWLHETLGDVTYQLTRFQLHLPGPYRWRPAINAFQCDKGMRICVDLAGVDRSQVDLTIEPQRLAIRGTRQAPEPADDEDRAVQMIAFEIDYGPFERILELPLQVDVAQASAEQRNGFLWIELPFRK